MQFIYGTGVEAFVQRADELATKYGPGFVLETKVREAIGISMPRY